MKIRNDTFLQFDSEPRDHRLIIFSSPEQLKILKETEEILIDGTFKVTPVIFTQLYTIPGVYQNSFLQPADVNQGFSDLYGSLTFILEPVIDYFEDTYIGKRRPNGCATPRYPVDLWNMHKRTIKNSMRTNNQVEAWHRRLNSVIQCEHPSLWIFIQSLQKEENYIRCQLVKVNAALAELFFASACNS
ncbi:unnamed protein product [Rotaria socialis]|uniref:MULE transposase domain-containing protein n=1 Tax=Rotaria socialis TaxID=392032 RepID=A0A821JK73_9BILA|nr:unnamed protein product [Rotaria socialis]CAF4722447.1 unnamed protein product [Rotaria socialis]